MSVEPTVFTCDKCDFKASSTVVWGRFYYQVEDERLIFLNRRLGWCLSCKTLSPVEDLSIEKVTHDEIRECEAELSDFENRGFLRKHLAGSKKKERIAYVRQRLEENLRLVEIPRSRKLPPRCLICSGNQIVSHKFSTSIDGDPSGKPFPTGFVHPDCGGNIVASSAGIRLMMRIKSRAYTTEGIFIREWYE